MSQECNGKENYGYDFMAVRDRFYEPSYNDQCERVMIKRSGHMHMLDWMALDTIMPQMRWGGCLPCSGRELCKQWMLWP